MSSVVTKVCKLSHKQFRAMLKKFRRKKKRQQLAKDREQQELLEQQKRENSPNFKAKEEERLRNEELYEQFQERERARQNKLWLLREEQAQVEFKKKQERLELEKIRKEEERKRILAEFEKQQFVEAQEVEQKEKIKTQKEEALQEALTKLSQEDEPWHNPIAPESYNSGKEKEKCQFFMKTGACRFGERCSRGHSYPVISSTILIRGMYTHLSIGQNSRDDYDTDGALEYEDKERYQDFLTFYDDVLPEFKKYGKVLQFKVCNNHEPHLRGNVYVQYPSEKEAVEAYKGFNGRFYAGKQLTCEFTHVVKWRSAICGLFARNKCPKGIECNFLHCFKNPGKEFFMADKDLLPLETFRNSQRNDDDRQRRESSRRSSSHYDYGYNDDYPDGRNSRRDSTRSSYRDRRDSSEERGSHRSSHYRTPRDRYDSHSSHRYRRHKSRSRSVSPYTSDEENERSNSSSKRKHKKKHSKKSKRKRSSSERSSSED
ncbi:U2 small nuclear ribonucleoprotein auxiliary factor 35 kDa subunit-related protein 1-like [Uloborus diversus]|uniref:U2 small nuclear ribonucleoprotein auxiliary factor 35 kDa subunit-related protein 1-like n=1 Tax=Uloborus diversus TaxID=327109 RepID=UPI00240A99D8|nr:U2 small nuclear ribonucleoprotein auxiliary factor 35 kDa subunit-related protein 1-like [Uloborus diversus]